MIQWLYRYVFRGIGILFLIGMVTVLILMVNSTGLRPERKAAPGSVPAARR